MFYDDSTTNGSSSSSNNNENEQLDDDGDEELLNTLNDDSSSTTTTSTSTTSTSMPLETIKRLLGAVSFGYGLFQIILSLIPPNLLKIVKLLGFEGDRGVGLNALIFTSNSKDLRAPFADLVLLWYSTIATPMYGFAENDLLVGDDDIGKILEKNLSKYPTSSFFFYFKGKYNRLIKNLPESLKSFEDSCKMEKCERQLEILSIEQIAWLHLMNLSFEKSLENFSILSKESKWSGILNTYASSLLCGCLSNFNEMRTFNKLAFDKAATTNNGFQYEVMALKRCQYFRLRQINSTTVYEMLVIELLLLWICLPYCESKALRSMLES